MTIQEWPVGGSPAPCPPVFAAATDSAYVSLITRAKKQGDLVRGHHNQNWVVQPVGGERRIPGCAQGEYVIVREPIEDALPVVIRTWQDEAAILDAVRGALPHVPRCLFRRQGTTVLSFVEGLPLSSVCPSGTKVDGVVVSALAELLADMTQVKRSALPALAQHWPRKNQGRTSYLRALVLAAEEQIRRPNWAAFGGLFAQLGVGERALTDYAERLPTLISRPFGLLHTDLHRDNVILPYGDGPPLICVDWELASYGDPLHDLATHLVRMRYPDAQWRAVQDAWRKAMLQRRPDAVNGFEQDLDHYVEFERAQSVYPDVMRAANSLLGHYGQADLDAAAREVHRALETARDPLKLTSVPDEPTITKILYRWQKSRGGQHAVDRDTAQFFWVRDDRDRPHPDFPDLAVTRALYAEGAAPADQVFKGTANLSTVVKVNGFPHRVMVRRKASAASPLERRFLDEYDVLRAIEEAGRNVRAPRALARGISELGDEFTIHTYEGPASGRGRPAHPVDGLTPREADDLVDQLCELTRVDHSSLSGEGPAQDFSHLLRAEMRRLVRELPRSTKEFGRQLGLPDHAFLDDLLTMSPLAPRTSVLLHGDLNPWNLVRREDGGLVLIDWEMAMVGDPLYDLIRHMHLTPTTPEIQDRMFARWSRQLPDEYTKGWEDDRRFYRRLETVRSAYVDLDRLVSKASLDAPNVRRAVDSYAMTLNAATAKLGLRMRHVANPYLVRALTRGGHGGSRTAGPLTGV
ncbi:aminoglycoside phosphotransferase family protein [Streptomyces sp. NPDC056637]|uniref:aminoglycoside phosphotransferase family protein n=1 Tax=Streptomyces sp. NPDC056637 TaxID=3345886 RepID=UPI0036ACF4AE